MNRQTLVQGIVRRNPFITRKFFTKSVGSDYTDGVRLSSLINGDLLDLRLNHGDIQFIMFLDYISMKISYKVHTLK